MPQAKDYYSSGAEALVVGLARTGDRHAFGELVRRRQSWIRNLMRRCCGDYSLADDMAQKAFLKAWQKISHLREPERFGSWLKRIAITIWLQYARKNDPMNDAVAYVETKLAPQKGNDVGIDLDRALRVLPNPVRLCIVLSYNEGMTHGEIAELTDLPLGTVKSHIRRGTKRLQDLLSAYRKTPSEVSP